MTVSIHNAALHANCQPKPRSILAMIGQMIAVAHQRRQLLALEDHLLEDIGISRQEARAESRQTVWNAPDHWHK